MTRDFDRPGQVFRTRNLIGKNQGQKIFRRHALKLRCDFSTAAPTWNRQRPRRIPTPANIEHGRIQQGLSQHITDSLRVEVAEDCLERKTMGRTEREHDRVFGCGRLQLEIERTTEALAQRQTPGAIQMAAERRMNHHVRAAVFIKEALGDDLFLSRHHTQRQLGQRQILNNLLSRPKTNTHHINQPLNTGSAGALARIPIGKRKPVRNLSPQSRHRD